MKKNTIGLLTGLAIAAVGAVGLLTRDQWMTGTPQPVAEPSTAKVAEPETPATQSASGEAPAAPAQTTTAEVTTTAEGDTPPPAPESSQAEAPAAEQQPAAETPAATADAPQTVQDQAAPEGSAVSEAPAAQTPAAPAEQPAATAEAPAASQEQQPAAPEQQVAVAPTESEPAAPATPEPATESAAPAQDQAAVQPEPAPAEPQQPAAPEQVPAFDTVRVEKTGEAVIAGTAEAGAEVVVKLDGEEIGKTTANGDGAFVLVPDEPLPAGSGELTIEAKGKGDLEATPSEQSVAVIVPAGTEQGALVAVMSPDEPTKVLQTPEPRVEPEVAAESTPSGEATAQAEAPAVAAEPEAAPEPETQVAVAPQPEVQAPAEPEPVTPRRVSIDAVDYDSAGNIVFSGKGTPGLTARIYVDNKHVGDAVIGTDGRWSFSGTADITPGVHALRVDGLDAAGKVASRIEVPFYREDHTVVAEAQPQAPQPEPAAPATDAPEAAAADGSQPAAPTAGGEQTAAATEADSGAAIPAEVPQKQDQEIAAAAQPEQQAEVPQKPKEGRVVIQPGNNLWRISRVLYGSGQKYTMLYQANKDQIRNPDLIYPGQIFKTPEVAARIETIDPKRRDPLKPEENAASAP